MCSPARSFFLGTIALFFHFCTFPSVLAPVPLVQRQLNLESQWARDFPGVIDGPEIENGGRNDQILADTNLVCCTVTESLIKKTFATCEGGMSFSFSSFFFSPAFFWSKSETLLPIYAHIYLPRIYCTGKTKDKGHNPPRIQNLTIGFNPSLTVTSETICDGTLYECPIHAKKLENVSKNDLVVVPMYINFPTLAPAINFFHNPKFKFAKCMLPPPSGLPRPTAGYSKKMPQIHPAKPV